MVSMWFELPSKWVYDWYKILVTNYIFGALWFCYCCAYAFDLDFCRCWPKNLFISNAIIGFKIVDILLVVWFILLLEDGFDLWFKYRRNALFFQSLFLKSLKLLFFVTKTYVYELTPCDKYVYRESLHRNVYTLII